MRIEFDEFEIEIRPKERGASFMEMLVKLFDSEAFSGFLDKLATMAEAVAVENLTPDYSGYAPLLDVIELNSDERADLINLFGILVEDGTPLNGDTLQPLIDKYPIITDQLQKHVAKHSPCESYTGLRAGLVLIEPPVIVPDISKERFTELYEFVKNLPAVADE